MKKALIALPLLAMALSASADVCHVIGYQNKNIYNGPTFCGAGSENAIIVNGTLASNGTQFQGNVLVHGPLDAKSTSFQKLSISSNTLGLTGSSASAIEVLKSSSTAQKVYLNSGSHVSNVTFDANAASSNLVIVDSSSSVGSVTNGTIEHA